MSADKRVILKICLSENETCKRDCYYHTFLKLALYHKREK